MGIEKGLEAEGYVLANRFAIPQVAKYPLRCSFFGCKTPIRAGELHVTMYRRGRQPESMHLGCACRRCWLSPKKALKSMKSAGGLGDRIDEMRQRGGAA